MATHGCYSQRSISCPEEALSVVTLLPPSLYIPWRLCSPPSKGRTRTLLAEPGRRLVLNWTVELRVGARDPPPCPQLQLPHLPAFFTKPRSASSTSHSSQRKQPGCQLVFMALITRPMTNSPRRGEISDVSHSTPHPSAPPKSYVAWCSPQYSLVQAPLF